MRRTTSLSTGLLLAFLMLPFGGPIFAQDPSDVALGMTPGTVYNVNDIDGVDMTTGRLNIHIPMLIDHSQRGKLNFTFQIFNNGSGAWYVQCGNPVTYQQCSWKSGTNGIGGLALGARDVLWPKAETERECCFGNAGIYYTFKVQTANDPTGPTHQLGTITTSPYVAESIDGSGIREVVDSNGQQSLIRSEGVQFHTTGTTLPLGSLVVDPNGNQMTTSVSSPQ